MVIRSWHGGRPSKAPGPFLDRNYAILKCSRVSFTVSPPFLALTLFPPLSYYRQHAMWKRPLLLSCSFLAFWCLAWGWPLNAQAAKPPVTIYFFWTEYCPHCAQEKEFLGRPAAYRQKYQGRGPGDIHRPGKSRITQESRESTEGSCPRRAVYRYRQTIRGGLAR